MQGHIPDSDWKLMEHLKPSLRDRLCERILDEIQIAAGNPEVRAHQRYLDVFGLVERRDRDVAAAFNDWRRSHALDSLIAIQRLELLLPEEIAQFTEATRNAVHLAVTPDDEP